MAKVYISCKILPPDLPVVDGVRFKIVETACGYIVGDDGSVWTSRSSGPGSNGYTRPWRKMNPSRTREGYRQVKLAPCRRVILVHKIVLNAFIGPCPPGMECLHADGNPSNNNLTNLTWGTKEDNGKDKRRHGTAKGELGGNARLTDEEVISMRMEYLLSGVTQAELAIKYGVTQPHVSAIITRKLWNHL